MDAIRVSSKKSWRLAVEFLSQAVQVQDGQVEPWQWTAANGLNVRT